MSLDCTSIRDLIAELRESGVQSAAFHPDGTIASVVLLPQTHAAHALATSDTNAREETSEEQKARLDALLFASA